MVIPPPFSMVAPPIMISRHVRQHVHYGFGDGDFNNRLKFARHMLNVSIKFVFKLIWTVPSKYNFSEL